MTNIAVLASGRGSNFRALCMAQRKDGLSGGKIRVLITDKAEAGAIETAGEFGIETVVMPPKDFPSREKHDEAVVKTLEERSIGLVCLAGYMRILSPAFISRFPGRIINIHPALLPSFPGLHGPKQAFEYGVKISGATVHFANEGCDTGEVIIQAAVPVEEGDTEGSLAARILEAEHRLYPQAVRLFCENRLKIEGRRVSILPPSTQGAGKT